MTLLFFCGFYHKFVICTKNENIHIFCRENDMKCKIIFFFIELHRILHN